MTVPPPSQSETWTLLVRAQVRPKGALTTRWQRIVRDEMIDPEDLLGHTVRVGKRRFIRFTDARGEA